MKRLKIVTVCGCGLGSSLIAKMAIDDILLEAGLEASIDTADGTSALGQKCDFYVTTKQFVDLLENCGRPVVAVSNFVNKDELRTKLLETIEQLPD